MVERKSDVKRKMLVILVILNIAVAWVTKVYATGWLTLLLVVPYALVTVIHTAVHILPLLRHHPMNRRQLTLIFTSHFLLAGAFLVQWDAGDGLGWLTISALLGKGPGYPDATPPLWWPRNAATFNIVVFVPVAVTWVLMTFRHFVAERSKW